jgi:hypothetical protein
MPGFRFALALALPLALTGCGAKRAPFANGSSTGLGRDTTPDAGYLHLVDPPPPAADAGGLCGNQIIPVVLDRPNFYFVLDASGSMREQMDTAAANGLRLSRFQSAIDAIDALLQSVGHRVAYGAALFPADVDPNTGPMCPAGAEVFPTTPGDPVSYAIAHKDGPILKDLIRTLERRIPSGLTPTAATLRSLAPKLSALPGTTYAFLLTDGAPNCDGAMTCDAAGCTVNIEGGCGGPTGPNCCDPANGSQDQHWCLDADPTVEAVAELATLGIETFVIGMPGTDAYATLLDRLAVAGGTARPAEPQYYPVTSATDLAATLQNIGLSIAIGCDVPLEQAPPEQHLVNVYFDQTTVPLDPKNGWTWTKDGSIRLVGDACTELKSGAVMQLQVVAGCPSVER